MLPSLPSGCTLVVDFSPFVPKVGDIVVCKECRTRGWIAHRIVGLPFTTKGDWSTNVDSSSSPLGKVVGWEHGGRVQLWNRGQQPLAGWFVGLSLQLVRQPRVLRWAVRLGLILIATFRLRGRLYSGRLRQTLSP